MRFTILTQYYPPEVGAPQARLAALARALQQRGHSVHVVTAMPNYPSGVVQPAYRGRWWMRECIEGIPVTRTWIYPATGRNVLKRLANYFSFTLSSLFDLARVPRADVLFVESPPLFLCLSAWLAAALRRQELCINISDLWPDSVVALGIMHDGSFVKVARWLERWLYRHAWRVCGVTEGVVRGIIIKGIPADKVMFLPNGVDTRLFQPTPLRRTKDRPYQFVYAGTHGYAHGVEVILYAASRLQKRGDIQFVLVGDGADKLRLQNLAVDLKLQNIVFRESIPIALMPALLAESYAALVTVAGGTFFDGTRSAKIFPAMAAGRAILHSGAGEGADLVRQSRSGIVTPPHDAEALAEAVVRLADSPGEAEAMGRRGREFVQREYSWPIVVDRWLNALGIEDASKR